uniref:Uncharacterized protein n=1 Tax=Lactuca sativa TaxID=4236 RepID=A0A9R1UPS2_LACSA|nr:hypothetical protein LSAT_V11C800419890 [Lactuca sativa]
MFPLFLFSDFVSLFLGSGGGFQPAPIPTGFERAPCIRSLIWNQFRDLERLVKVDLQNSQNELPTSEQQKSDDKMLKLVYDQKVHLGILIHGICITLFQFLSLEKPTHTFGP